MKKFTKCIHNLYHRMLTYVKKHLIGIAVIWFVVGFILPFIYLCIYHNVTWEVLTGFATWILAGGVVVAIWQAAYYKYQADEQADKSRKSINAQVAVELFKELRSEDTKKTLRYIYNLSSKRISENFDKLPYKVKHITDKFELLGVLVNEGIVDERLAIETYAGPPVLKCWYQLGECYIKEMRKKRGLFGKYFEDFAARTFMYQRDNSPKSEWICFRRGTRGEKVNLVKYYIDHPKIQPTCQKSFKV